MTENADYEREVAETSHAPCWTYPGQWYNKSTGDCSCGQRHTGVRTIRCSCAHHSDGSVTTSLCPLHAKQDPCLTMAAVTGKRRRGSIVRGVCSACGWSAKRGAHNDSSEATA